MGVKVLTLIIAKYNIPGKEKGGTLSRPAPNLSMTRQINSIQGEGKNEKDMILIKILYKKLKILTRRKLGQK